MRVPKIWWEGFGKKTDPLLILIMGAGCQGIIWSSSFCEKLASFGFYVVRFDHRDTGKSSKSLWLLQKVPYTLWEMAEDVLCLMKTVGHTQMHIIGISMGGAIAQILAAHCPEQILSLGLIATSADFRPVTHVLGAEGDPGPLSLPAQKWISLVKEMETIPKICLWKLISKQFEAWKILQGEGFPFDEVFYRSLFKQVLWRQPFVFSLLNHQKALIHSNALLLETQGKIRAPAYIFHGEEDPLFFKDHAEHLAKSIPYSQLLYVKEMGHSFHPRFYEDFFRYFVKCVQDKEL